jgi:hypothetical protein
MTRIITTKHAVMAMTITTLMDTTMVTPVIDTTAATATVTASLTHL